MSYRDCAPKTFKTPKCSNLTKMQEKLSCKNANYDNYDRTYLQIEIANLQCLRYSSVTNRRVRRGVQFLQKANALPLRTRVPKNATASKCQAKPSSKVGSHAMLNLNFPLTAAHLDLEYYWWYFINIGRYLQTVSSSHSSPHQSKSIAIVRVDYFLRSLACFDI